MAASFAVDVVVVGAGLAGLSAAYSLAKAGASVLVLEARSRVGGRTCSQEAQGTIWDVGGQWIGATQHAVRNLIKELGIQMYPQYDSGKHILEMNGIRSEYSGNISTLNMHDLGELDELVSKFDKLMLEVPLDKPYNAPKALEWDSITMDTWQRLNVKSEKALQLMNFIVRTVFASEPSQISFLFFLWFLRQGGGYNILADIHGGAQQDKVIGGTQQISDKMAERLGTRVILNSPVSFIKQDSNGVLVTSTTGTYRSKYVIVAVPPSVTTNIRYEPTLPGIRDQLAQRMPGGCVIKCLILYKRAFWKERGYSGEVLTTAPPLCLLYDATTHDGKQPALVGFTAGASAVHWGTQPVEVFHKAIIDELVSLYGEDARSPVQIITKDWTQEEFSRGCYVGIMPTGTLTVFGKVLREPFGRIHWASTETATEWLGYMDGAVSSGQRAAKEILAKVNTHSKL